MDDFRFQSPSFIYPKQADCYRQRKPPRTTRAGVEVKNAFAAVEIGLMGMPEEDRSKFCRGGIKVKRGKIVKHVNVKAIEEQHICCRQLRARPLAVNVAAYRGDGSDGAQSFEDS